MIDKPRLKTFLTVFPISETTWGLRGGTEQLWRLKLNDPRAVEALGALLPFLNGSHPTGEILAQIERRGVDRGVAERLLEQLEKIALLEEAESDGLSPQDAERFRNQLAFFSRFTTAGGAKLQSRLGQSRIAMVGDGDLHRTMIRQLAASGIGALSWLGPRDATGGNGHRSSLPEHFGARLDVLPLDLESLWPADREDGLPDLFAVPVEAYDPLLLEAMDTFSKQRGVPWLLVRLLDPHEGWVGPLFVPGSTPSYVSLEARLRGNLDYFEEYEAFDGFLRAARHPSVPCGGLHAFGETLGAIATAEIVKYLTGIGTPTLAGRFLTVDLMTWNTEIHQVLRVPRLEAESYSRPQVFPWKEMPYGDKLTRRA